MNIKTTVLLAVLAAGAGWFAVAGPDAAVTLRLAKPPAITVSPSLEVLASLTPETITRVEVQLPDDPVVLTATGTGKSRAWSLPGNWPVRTPEAEHLIALIGGLKSRFQPIPAEESDLKHYGLAPEQKPLTVKVAVGDKEHTLRFGRSEELLDENPFAQPTFLRVDAQPEVVRLGPGILEVLQRPREDYQRRQLFPATVRVKFTDAGFGESPSPVNLPDAITITLKGPSDEVQLARVEALPKAVTATGSPRVAAVTMPQLAQAWQLAAPVKDRADQDKLKGVLAAVPDLWVEKFIKADKKDLDEYGLKEPEYTITVTRVGEPLRTLSVGRVSRVETRKAPPPPPPQFGQPPPPPPPPIREEYRYAKLPDTPQLFEVRADKFAELFVAAKDLRDARLARFRTADATGLTIEQGGTSIVLAKEKDADGLERWKLKEPVQAVAESGKVTELIDKLADLQARDADVLDKADLKASGLDPAKVKVTITVEEELPRQPDDPATEDKDAKPKKRPRTVTFLVGGYEAEKNKLFVKVQGNDRVNLVADDVQKLVDRPALAYRGRRLFDFSATQLAMVAIQRASEAFTLTQQDADWKLTVPVVAAADKTKAGSLADELSRLEVVEYVNDDPKDADLAAYGLDKPALTATLTFSDPAKQPQKVLQIGKAREGKPEFFARVVGSPSVFVVKQELKDALDQSSLALRPLQLWSGDPGSVSTVVVQRATDEYTLKREGFDWKITGPFDAAAQISTVQPLLEAIGSPKAERYEAHIAKDLAAYGLDKPSLTLTVTESRPSTEPEGKTKDETHTLLIGKPTAADQPTRFAKLANADGVFVIGEAITTAADKPALDLLDRKMLRLTTDRITRVESKGPAGTFVMTRDDKGGWTVDAKPPFAADAEAISGLMRIWGNLQAYKFAAYGPKTNFAEYGLEPPETTVTVTLKPADEKAKPETHLLAVGKKLPNSPGDRYARVDGGPAVAVLLASTAEVLDRSPLDYADRSLLKFAAQELAAISRQAGGQEFEIARQAGEWSLVKPTGPKPDQTALDDLADDLANLRAEKIVALDAKDRKPFGLDPPAAVVTLKTGPEGKTTDKVLKIGKPVDEKAPGERFVQVEGTTTVAVLPAKVATTLLADPLKFQDRTIARFPDADRLTLERGSRKATFAKVNGVWKLTDPLSADAEQSDLDDFLSAAARLRADELVAQKPENLKPYGLDTPALRWRFFRGDKDVLNLLVGTRDKDGRAFAKLDGGDLVFLLDPAMSNRVHAEYRKRAVFTGLDAAQLNVLTISGGVGASGKPETFVLRKTDAGGWEVAGQADKKVVAEKVNETLASLAGLKVDHFAADKGADLKLYGLEPPQFVIVTQSPSGTPQVLHIGRAEGDSKRLYARAGTAVAGEVFVLAESDAAKLTRGLSDYLAK